MFNLYLHTKKTHMPSLTKAKQVFPRKKTTVSAYTKALPASIKTRIRVLFKDEMEKAGYSPSNRQTCSNDEHRGLLGGSCKAVADSIETRHQRPTDLSRKIFDIMCNVHEDIQVNRDAK